LPGRALYNLRSGTPDEGVPLGLIESAWGGTVIEAWIPIDDQVNSLDLRFTTHVLPVSSCSSHGMSPASDYCAWNLCVDGVHG